MFKVPDLRNKILFTLFIVLLYRIGAAIPSPGVDAEAVQAITEGGEQNGIIGLLSLFSGGALEQLSVFALGVIPYITASIIMQLLTGVIPRLQKMQEEGEGQRITQWTRYATVVLAVLQSFGFTFLFRNGSLTGGINPIPNDNAGTILLVVVTMTAGTASRDVVGRADHPARYRKRNVIVDLHQHRLSIAWTVRNRPTDQQLDLDFRPARDNRAVDGHWNHLRRTGPASDSDPVRKTCSGSARYGWQHHLHPAESQQCRSYPGHLRRIGVGLPRNPRDGGSIRPETSGPRFATSSTTSRRLEAPALVTPGEPSGHGMQVLYISILFLLVVFFTYFYTALQFDPTKQAEQVQRQGGYIQGHPARSSHLPSTSRRSSAGSLCRERFSSGSSPSCRRSCRRVFNIQFGFGGTSILIVVGVALETMKQVESQLMMRDYDGFLA